MYFPVRFHPSYCVALQLRTLELAYPLHGEHRIKAPLFVQEVGTPVTFHVLSKLLTEAKPLIMPKVEDPSCYTYVPQFSGAVGDTARLELVSLLGGGNSVYV